MVWGGVGEVQRCKSAYGLCKGAKVQKCKSAYGLCKGAKVRR